MTVVGALMSVREPGEMSPQKRSMGGNEVVVAVETVITDRPPHTAEISSIPLNREGRSALTQPTSSTPDHRSSSS